MEKIKVKICEREFNLLTDDAPEIIIKSAGKVEEKIIELSALRNRSEVEMLMLVALNLTSEAEKDMFAVKHVIGEMHKKVSMLEEENLTLKETGKLTLNANIDSITRELEQIAQVRDEENEQLRKKLAEQENQIEIHMKEREVEIKRLHDGFDSAAKEMAYIAEVKDGENKTLRNTLNTYETTFDNYVKLKEEEIIKLRKELDDLKLEYEALKVKCDKNDGQLSLRRL